MMTLQAGWLLRHAIALGAVALGLGGCASESGGIVPGAMPEPAPFVVQSRPAATPSYPAIGVEPPARSDKVLTPEEQAKLRADLERLAAQRKKAAP